MEYVVEPGPLQSLSCMRLLQRGKLANLLLTFLLLYPNWRKVLFVCLLCFLFLFFYDRASKSLWKQVSNFSVHKNFQMGLLKEHSSHLPILNEKDCHKDKNTPFPDSRGDAKRGVPQKSHLERFSQYDTAPSQSFSRERRQ